MSDTKQNRSGKNDPINNMRKEWKNMSSLYDLTEEFETIINMLYDPEVDEQLIFDTLEGIEYELEDKAVAYAKIIKNLQADAEKIKEEEERLASRREMFEERAKRMKGSLEESMRITGKTKFKTPLFSFSIQKNGGKQALTLDVDVTDLPVQYQIPQDPLPYNEKIREFLSKENTDRCSFAHLEPRGESLRITGIKAKGR